jgi:hypothetical protein
MDFGGGEENIAFDRRVLRFTANISYFLSAQKERSSWRVDDK